MGEGDAYSRRDRDPYYRPSSVIVPPDATDLSYTKSETGMDIKGFVSDDGIFHFSRPIEILKRNTKLFPSELVQYFKSALEGSDLAGLWGDFKTNRDIGLSCRYLKSGQHWQSGRIVVKIEFIPDEPETTDELDGLR